MKEIAKAMSEDNNGYRKTYPRDLFLQTLSDEGGEATTAEITSEVGCSGETTRIRMRELEDDDLVESSKIGPTLVWTLV
jgi:uncharacterized membrane protein